MPRKLPLLFKVNPEHLTMLRESDIKVRGTEENPCCDRLGHIDYLTVPGLGMFQMNVNFCFVCGKKIERGKG